MTTTIPAADKLERFSCSYRVEQVANELTLVREKGSSLVPWSRRVREVIAVGIALTPFADLKLQELAYLSIALLLVFGKSPPAYRASEGLRRGLFVRTPHRVLHVYEYDGSPGERLVPFLRKSIWVDNEPWKTIDAVALRVVRWGGVVLVSEKGLDGGGSLLVVESFDDLERAAGFAYWLARVLGVPSDERTEHVETRATAEERARYGRETIYDRAVLLRATPALDVTFSERARTVVRWLPVLVAGLFCLLVALSPGTTVKGHVARGLVMVIVSVVVQDVLFPAYCRSKALRVLCATR